MSYAFSKRYEMFLDPFCTPFGDVCMTQLKYYLRKNVCTTWIYQYFQKQRYLPLNCYLVPCSGYIVSIKSKVCDLLKNIHRSILHFSLGEVGMGKNIMCFLSWLACFLFFANIGYRACPSKLLEWISSICGFYGD